MLHKTLKETQLLSGYHDWLLGSQALLEHWVMLQSLAMYIYSSQSISPKMINLGELQKKKIGHGILDFPVGLLCS